MAIGSIIKNALRVRYFPVMVGKVITRLKEPGLKAQKRLAESWAKEESVPLSKVLETIDKGIYHEAEKFYQDLVEYGKEIEKELPVKMGAGGNCFLLYFLCKKYIPETIVETGVSMGYSSQTVLSCIKENSVGHLYSSDFPYFRIDNPEKYIGCIVEESLKENWTLKTAGDRKNLPEIVQDLQSIDLFHFDSDKSISGREFAWNLIQPLLKPNSTTVFDDITDNLHFKSICNTIPEDTLVVYDDVFGDYVGIIGALARDYNRS